MGRTLNCLLLSLSEGAPPTIRSRTIEAAHSSRLFVCEHRGYRAGILLGFAHEGYNSSIKVEFKKGSFVIYVDCVSLQNLPNFVTVLSETLGFAQIEGRLSKTVSPAAIESSLLRLAQAVEIASHTESSHI